MEAEGRWSLTSFTVHPKQFADCLANAVAISKEAKGVNACPHILLAYQPDTDGRNGCVIAYGFGRYAGGRSTVRLNGLPSNESTSLCLTREDADGLQSILRKVGGGKAASVTVDIHPDPVQVTSMDEHGMQQTILVNLVVKDGTTVLCETLDSDPAGDWDAVFDRLDEWIAFAAGPVGTPVAFNVDILSRLAKIKSAAPVVDLKATSHDRIVAVAVGDEFRGVIGDTDRAGYAAGGPWADGPGAPEHLF